MDVDLALIERTIALGGQPAYRRSQVWAAAASGAPDYEAITTLPRALRAELALAVPFSTLALEREARARDGTVNALLRTGDGHPV